MASSQKMNQSPKPVVKQQEESEQPSGSQRPSYSLKKAQSDSEDEFEPGYHTMKKMKMPINRFLLTKGAWTKAENRIYLGFLYEYREYLDCQDHRREKRVFCVLGELLKRRRTPDQCRSHHMKLLAKHKQSLEDVILQVTRKVQGVGKQQSPQKIKKKDKEAKVHCQRVARQGYQLQEGIEADQRNKVTEVKAQQPAQEPVEEPELISEASHYKMWVVRGRNILRIQINTSQMQGY